MSMLTQEQFDRLLDALDPDRAAAGEAYQRLRSALVKYLRWEGCTRAEDWADEVLNRVAQRLTAGEVVTRVAAYASGVARLVVKEALRSQAREYSGVIEMPAPVADEVADESVYECLEECLRRLEPDQRELILQYYQGTASKRIRNRQKLAGQLGISLNSLRNRALRLREKLELCMRGCGERDVLPESNTKTEDAIT